MAVDAQHLDEGGGQEVGQAAGEQAVGAQRGGVEDVGTEALGGHIEVGVGGVPGQTADGVARGGLAVREDDATDGVGALVQEVQAVVGGQQEAVGVEGQHAAHVVEEEGAACVADVDGVEAEAVEHLEGLVGGYPHEVVAVDAEGVDAAAEEPLLKRVEAWQLGP